MSRSTARTWQRPASTTPCGRRSLRQWIDGLRNTFLIRQPDKVLASYDQKRPAPTLADIGIEQQAELFERMHNRDGTPPPVIDADDVQAALEAALQALCDALSVRFDPAAPAKAMASGPATGTIASGSPPALRSLAIGNAFCRQHYRGSRTKPCLFTTSWRSTACSLRVDEGRQSALGLCRTCRMGGRVVECTGLENRRACKRTVGSNPTPSAIDLKQTCLCPKWHSLKSPAFPGFFAICN